MESQEIISSSSTEENSSDFLINNKSLIELIDKEVEKKLKKESDKHKIQIDLLNGKINQLEGTIEEKTKNQFNLNRKSFIDYLTSFNQSMQNVFFESSKKRESALIKQISELEKKISIFESERERRDSAASTSYYAIENSLPSPPKTPKKNKKRGSPKMIEISSENDHWWISSSLKRPRSNSSNNKFSEHLYYLESRLDKLENAFQESKKTGDKFYDFKKEDYFSNLIYLKKEDNSFYIEQGKNTTNTVVEKNCLKNSIYLSKIKEFHKSGYREGKNETYVFTSRVIRDSLTLPQWLNYNNGNHKNEFDPRKIENSFEKGEKSKKVFLGTGAGKSTFFVRCIAFHQGGLTVVVPNDQLAHSFTNSHKWLGAGKDLMLGDDGKLIDDPEKRVTVCQICQENHGPYDFERNGESKLINVFTWNEFFEAFVLKSKRKMIKKVIMIDEAHVKEEWYTRLIDMIKNLNHQLELKYKIIETSATFSDLPSSSHLRGIATDMHVSIDKLDNFFNENPQFLKKKTVIFCPSPHEYFDLKQFTNKKIEFLILNDEIRDFASEIVRSSSAKIIFADTSYSLGFSFGDVNVISTGISSRNTVTKDSSGKFKIEKETIASQFEHFLQERGRGGREISHNFFWISLVGNNSSVKFAENPNPVVKDIFDKFLRTLKKERDGVDSIDKETNNFLKTFNKKRSDEKIIKELIGEEKSYQYFKDILYRTLVDNFLKETLIRHNANTEKNGKEWIKSKFYLESDFINVFSQETESKKQRQEDYKSIINLSTFEMMKKSFELSYPWAKRTDLDKRGSDFAESYVFKKKDDIEKVILILSLRDEKIYTVNEVIQKGKKSRLEISITKKVIDELREKAFASYEKSF